jgi:membrane protease YdiL (CAAX protease family)
MKGGWLSGLTCGAVLWLASLVELAIVRDFTVIEIAAGFAVFLTLAWLVTKTIVRVPTEPPDDVLRAAGDGRRVVVRALFVAAFSVLVACVAFDFAGFHVVAWFFGLWRAVARTVLPSLGSSSPKFILTALLPGVVVLALGARFRQIGLGRGARGTLWATLACTSPFLVAFAVRLVQGRLSLAQLGLYLAHNVLSNGFSEEFLSRGLILAHARAFLRSDWALLVEALAFSLFHLGVSMRDEPTTLGCIANVVALNGPMGYVLGLMTLRTRNLVLPSALHTAFDTVRNVFA